MFNRIKYCFFSLFFLCSLYTQKIHQEIWVDSVYSSMNIDQRVGQLYSVWTASRYGQAEINEIKHIIDKYHIGGLIFSLGSIDDQIISHNIFQKQSNIPLLISMDAEWGLGMRLEDGFSFPYNITLGAIRDDSLIFNVGQRIGEHLKKMGVHLNFAPVSDVNTNPKNPIIGARSFGENKFNVSKKSIKYIEGLNESGVLAVGKHFPGHGDTRKDSHFTLPVLNYDSTRIDSIELYPFKQIINNGVDGIMTAHLKVKSLDDKMITTLSRKIINDLLKVDLGFEGIVITDALDMKAIVDYSKGNYPDVDALIAGNDILLMPTDLKKSISEIKKAVLDGRVTEKRLEDAVKKILKTKYKVGLNKYKPIPNNNIKDQLNSHEDYALFEKLAEKSMTLIKNERNLIPLSLDKNLKVGLVNLGNYNSETFHNYLNNFRVVEKIDISDLKKIKDANKRYDKIIVSVHKADKSPFEDYKLSKNEISIINTLKKNNEIIFVIFSNPYTLLDINLNGFESVLVAYQNSNVFQKKASEAIFGANDIDGVLPVTIGKSYEEGTSIVIKKSDILSFDHPINLGVDMNKLNKIDSLINHAIKNKMTPGAQLLIAKNSNIIYHNSFGYKTYEKKHEINNNSIYDLASLTKILVSVPLLLKEFTHKNFDLTTKLADWFPEMDLKDKKNLSVKQLFSHYSGMKSWIPFYKKTIDSVTNKRIDKYFSKTKSKDFPFQVLDELYIKNYNDTIFNEIVDSELSDSLTYVYSDLPYFLLKFYLEKTYKTSLDTQIKEFIYDKIGSSSLTYKPTIFSPNNSIVPTVIDDYFRFDIVQGHVHDMGAAMMDGVSGHAGLFGNSLDVAKVLQLFLQKGSYSKKIFFDEKNFNLFNFRHFEDEKVRRGIGFDKPELNTDDPNTCGCVSESSFGHYGFTGSMVWVDPEKEIIYVFLSNRTYPDESNNSLSEFNIRTELQKIVHEAFD